MKSFSSFTTCIQSPKRLLGTVSRHALTRSRAFTRDEDGSMLVLAMSVLLVVMICGGMAVDFMRTEYLRTELQDVNDRAVLAAADLDQTLDAQDVVTDYYTKAGLVQYLGNVTVDEGFNYRTVTAESSAQLDTAFLKMAGVDTLPAIASGGAEERIGDVEISMVLDVSGSMGSYSRLTNMQTAANDFVDTIFANSEPGRTSISIIPYSTQVSAGDDLLSEYNVTAEHTNSACVDFTSSDFNGTSLSTTTLLQRTGHFDPWNYSKPPSSLVCKTEWHREIQAISDDTDALHAQINAFTASGNTSTDIGVKWGVTLLDPGTQGVVTDMIANGHISNDFAGRPANYDDNDTIKAMVVMTDGVNTSQYYLNDGYESGQSDVYYNASQGTYSIRYTSGGQTYYYWPHNGYRRTYPHGGSSANTRLDYAELWEKVSIPYNAYYFMYPIRWSNSDYYAWYYDPRGYVNSSTKDSRLSNICTAAKDEGILIYTIGFEMTDSSAAVMRDCASSDSHFFLVEGVEIADAFAAIASSINQLRLIE